MASKLRSAWRRTALTLGMRAHISYLKPGWASQMWRLKTQILWNLARAAVALLLCGGERAVG